MNDGVQNTLISSSLDQENPNSIVSMVEGDAFANAIAKVASDHWLLSEEELKAKAKPTRTDYALRLALWNEIRLASASGQTIAPSRIYTSICSYQHWYHNILNNPIKLAWLLCPIQEYEQSLKPLLVQIAERYNEILNLDIYDEKGKPVPALVKLVLRAMEQVEGRLLGSPIHRSENKNLNVLFNPRPESVEEKLERLRAERAEQRRIMDEEFRQRHGPRD